MDSFVDRTDCALTNLLALPQCNARNRADLVRAGQKLWARAVRRTPAESRDLDDAPAAYAVIDRQGRITRINATAARLLRVEPGRSSDLFLGTRLAAENERVLLDSVARVLSTGEEETVEVGLGRPPEPQRDLRLVIRRENRRRARVSPAACRVLLMDSAEIAPVAGCRRRPAGLLPVRHRRHRGPRFGHRHRPPGLVYESGGTRRGRRARRTCRWAALLSRRLRSRYPLRPLPGARSPGGRGGGEGDPSSPWSRRPNPLDRGGRRAPARSRGRGPGRDRDLSRHHRARDPDRTAQGARAGAYAPGRARPAHRAAEPRVVRRHVGANPAARRAGAPASGPAVRRSGPVQIGQRQPGTRLPGTNS